MGGITSLKSEDPRRRHFSQRKKAVWKEQPAARWLEIEGHVAVPSQRTKEMNFPMSLFQTSSALHLVLSGEPMDSQPERLLGTLNTAYTEEHVRGHVRNMCRQPYLEFSQPNSRVHLNCKGAFLHLFLGCRTFSDHIWAIHLGTM